MIKTYWETITPERAASLLQLNIKNRRVRKGWVDTLAKTMAEGGWKEDGNTIKFNSTHLLDGQHRLLACVQSGCSFRTLVVEGVEDEAMSSIDYIKPRNASDFLHFNEEKNTSLIASSLNLLNRYLTSRLRRVVVYTPENIWDLLQEHPEIRKGVEYASRVKSKLLVPSVVSTSYFLITQKNPVEGVEFMDKLIHGTNLDERSPIYTLRERLMNDVAKRQTKRSSHNQVDLLVYVLKAWNAHRKGQTQRIYVWKENEDAPVLTA